MATFNATFTNETQFNANFKTDSSLSAGFGQITMVETGDYGKLANKPKINGVTLIGDKSIEELGVDTLTNTEILEIYKRVFGG